MLGPWGWEDPLEKGTATHSSILENPRTEEPGGLQSIGSQKSRTLLHACRPKSKARPFKDERTALVLLRL